MNPTPTKGKVIEIVRTTCPCGWKPPIKLTVEGYFIGHGLEVHFQCPDCGRSMMKRASDEARVAE